jgi:hypothetical protein
MGLGQEPETTFATTIASYLAHRSTLIVLDNCEHVADSARRFVEDLGTGAPSPVFTSLAFRLGAALLLVQPPPSRLRLAYGVTTTPLTECQGGGHGRGRGNGK